MKQEVLEDPNDDLVGYRTEFILSCRKKYEVFEFGDKLTSVEYFCNRRYVLLYITMRYNILRSGWTVSEPGACQNLSMECQNPLEPNCMFMPKCEYAGLRDMPVMLDIDNIFYVICNDINHLYYDIQYCSA